MAGPVSKTILWLFLLLNLLQMAKGYSFQSGNNGQVMWALGCDFYGNDIGNQVGTGQDCGGLCIGNPMCTHFSWSNGVCYLKQATNPPATNNNANGAICGWVNNRSVYKFQSGNNGQVMWALGCDFYGNDIGNQAGPGSDCGGVCLANAQCTHFSWSNNVCYLKHATNPSAANSNINGAVCGWVTSRQGIIFI